MNTFAINVGHDNFVPSDKILAVLSRSTKSIKPIISKSELNERLIDATFGRSTESVIITTDNYVLLSSIKPKTIAKRFAEETDSPIISCGGENYIPNEQITAILNANSEPIMKLLTIARAHEKEIKCKKGNKLKCIIVTTTGYVFQSFVEPKTIAKKRFNNHKQTDNKGGES